MNKPRHIPRRASRTRAQRPICTNAWERRKLGEIVTRSSTIGKQKDLPRVEYEDIISGAGQLNKDLSSKVCKKHGIEFNIGDVLYGKLRPYLKNWLFPSFRGLAVGDFWVLQAQTIEGSFLYRLIQSPNFEEIANQSTGTKMPRADWNLVSRAAFAIPISQTEQSKIGELLEHLDRLITLHQRKYEKLVNVKKSMLEKMFPKNDELVPEIRFAGFTNTWERRKLGDFCTEVTRRDAESAAPIMMISASSGFIEQSEKYSSDNAGQSLEKYILLKRGELAYNHGASKLRKYGSCFALNIDEARVPFVYHCFDVGDNNSNFTAMILNVPQIDNQLRRLVSSGARMDGLLNISFDAYKTVEIKLPCRGEQDKIEKLLNSLDRLITLHQRKLERLQNIKKSFLEKMFV